MSGLTLKGIREALAEQIADGLARQVNCYPYEVDDPALPYVIVKPSSGTYVGYFASFGPSGVADVMFDLEVAVVAADAISMGIAMDDLLSSGTGNNSSLVDAIHEDRTLGGLVADCVALSATVEPLSDTPLVAIVPVMIRVRKSGASA